MNVNVQVTVAEPPDYTKEWQSNFERVSHSVQHIDNTSYSTSSGSSLSAISLKDMMNIIPDNTIVRLINALNQEGIDLEAVGLRHNCRYTFLILNIKNWLIQNCD